MIHAPCGAGQLLRRDRHGVPLRENERAVIRHKHVHSEALTLLLLHAQIDWGNMLPHLTAELVQLLPAVADTLLGKVAVGGKAAKAVGARQLVACADQLAQELLHRLRVFQHRFLLCLIGGAAALPVKARHGGAKLSAAEHLALHLVLCGGGELLILRGKLGYPRL